MNNNFYNNTSLAKKNINKSIDVGKNIKYKSTIKTTKSSIWSLLLGVLIIFVPVIFYFSVKSNVTSNKIVIAQLNSDFDTMKMENDAVESEIKDRIDLNNIYNIAVNRLQMKKVTVDDIKYYKIDSSDYFKQNLNLSK